MAHAFGNGYVEQARRRGVREDANTSPEVTHGIGWTPICAPRQNTDDALYGRTRA